MPLGASRISFLAKTSVAVEAEVIRKKISLSAVGNADISTSASKFGGSSAYFDGGTTYIVMNGNDTDVDFSGDFTIECWINITSPASGNQKIFDLRGINAVHPGGDTTFSLGDTLLIDNNSGSLRVFVDGSDRATLTSGEFSGGTWQHFAIQRQSGTINAWVDGTRAVNYAGSDDYTSVFAANQPIGVNAETTSIANKLTGYIDEIRISTVARYTNGSSITVPTAPFTNDDNTYLLAHMNGTDNSTFFEDDNGTGRSQVGVRGNGNAQIDTDRYKFGGSSALFDGTGDYLNADIDIPTEIGTGACTWECFFNVDVDAGSGTVAVLSNRNGGASNGEVQMLFRNFDMKIQVNGYGTGAFSANGVGPALATDTWHHYVWARNASGTWRIWVNGSSVANGTGYTQSLTADGGFGIGAHADGGIPINSGTSGWIDEVRISNTDVYGVSNTSITVPTAAFTNDSNTVFLSHMNGTDGDTDFRDDNGKGRSPVGVRSVGGASISTTQSKFGGSSGSFDATDDHLLTPLDQSFWSSAWTIEFWFYTGSTGTLNIIAQTQSGPSTEENSILLRTTNGKIRSFLSSDGSSWDIFNSKYTSDSYTTNSWNHYAIQFDGTNDYRHWLNGVDQGSETNSSTVNDSGYDNFFIGGAYGSTAWFGDYLDEVRFSSTSRYSSGAITVPTEPFQNDANTLLLLHMDGTNGSTTIIDDNGTYQD